MLIDYATIIARARWVREKAGLVGKEPPYSTRHILETVFPSIAVAGDNLTKNVSELAVADAEGRRALYYNRNMPHSTVRVGLMHGLYHHLEDMRTGLGLAECNLSFRKLAQKTREIDPLELACDMFAAEVLIPGDVLDRLAPDIIYTDDQKLKDAISDEIDHLSSKFNVPKGFMRWRLHDLHNLRRTHYNTHT
jgi:Zn-dependent peptidase ImmA (M78 family)